MSETMQQSATRQDNGTETAPKLQKRLFTFLLNKRVPPIPDESERQPFREKKANVLSKLLFAWLLPIMKVGYKRTLVPEDMYYLTEDMKVEQLAQRFYVNFAKLYDKEHQKWQKKHPNDSEVSQFKMSKYAMGFAVYKTFMGPYNWSFIFLSLSQLSQTLNPLLIKKLIQFVDKRALGEEVKLGKGIGYAFGVTILILFNGLALNQAFYRAMTVGAQTKAVLTKVVLDKSFKLDAQGKHDFPVGKITSIMGTDLSRIDFALGLQPFVVVFPVPIIAAIVVLVTNIGPVALVGVAIMVLFLVGMSFSTKALFRYRKSATVFTDGRVNYIKECLNNLRMIKYYSWEIPYYDNIAGVRLKEMKIVRVMQILRNVITALAMNLSGICSMVTFLVLYAAGGSNDPANIFSSFSVFNVLTQVLFLMPMALAAGSDASVGLGRVAEFLSCGEESDNKALSDANNAREYMAANNLAIKLENACFEWEVFENTLEESDKNKGHEDKEIKEIDEKESDVSETECSGSEKSPEIQERTQQTSLQSSSVESESTLQGQAFPGLNDIDLEIRKGEFVVITGVIGSGKSSLLQAMAGFMKKTGGSLAINGSLLLCGQPWIQNATLKENIVFGSKFDEQRYSEVVYSCSLESDLSVLPAGDRTEIGERGITLSGGQKARLNLARAVYVDKDIILLDDVLSAVDARVGKHIMENCIQGMLKGKTRILATHQLSLVDSADRIIFLNGDGSVSVGDMDSLSANNEGFRHLMAFNKATEQEEEEEVEHKEEEEVKLEQIQSQIKTQALAGPGQPNVEEEAKHKQYNTDTTADGRLGSSENKSESSTSRLVYKRYFTNGCKSIHPVVMLILLVVNVALATFCYFFTSVWLSFWTEHKFRMSDAKYIGVYATLAIGAFLLFLAEFVMIVSICNRSATILNIKAMERVLYSKMSFLDTTPMGRILNRFTKDTDVLDNELGEQIRYLVFTTGNIIGIFVLCIVFLPWFALAIPVVGLAIVAVASFYMSSSREVKRLESVQRSFVYNNFNESLNGMNTIKAYKATDRFLGYNAHYIDKMNESYLITIAVQRWLTFYLALIAGSFTLIVSMLCVNGVFSIGPASTGLLLSFTLQLTGQLSMFIRNFTQVENGMNSVERICDFAYDLEEEAPYTISETSPPPNWPERGEITFDNVSMAYRPGLPCVLKNVNLQIRSQEKIGISGRTGAGKSSIMTALYRIAELNEGKIEIDGLDIAKLGLKQFRSKLSIIPQDPILFKSSIRRNLDPFGESSDDKLWDALRRSGLIDADRLAMVKQQTGDDETLHKFHLDQMVEDDGANFSLGERQLLAFARALVRDSKILILDEATSSVDYETDAKIQSTIAREFGHCTILCIAHRLKTIVNYDRILVLDHGEVAEFDTPWNLFKSDGIFSQMCQKSGIVAGDFDDR